MKAAAAATPADAASRRQVARLGALAWFLYAALAARFWWVCDDAFISFRYARHLARGLGLRYNPRLPGPPVEGYSNFLWTMAAALLERLGASPARWLPWLSFACGSALLWLLARRLARWRLPSAAIAVGLLFVAASPAFAAWSTSGLETMPFALALFLAGDGLVLGDDRRSALVGGSAALTATLLRPEGLLWGIGLFALGALGRRASRAGRRPLLPGLALFVIGAGIYETWRLTTFGAVMPNAVSAKVALSLPFLARGLRYAGLESLTLVTPLVAFAGIPAARRRLGGARSAALAAAAATPFAFAVAVGGDFLPWARFLVPALPFLALLASCGAADFAVRARPARRRLGGLLAALLLLAGLLPAWNVHLAPLGLRAPLAFRKASYPFLSELDMWRLERDQVPVFTRVGATLRGATAPGDSIVFGIIGAVGYVSDRTIFDRYGLVTPAVARRPSRPGSLVMPGHDREVSVYFFLPERPTILLAEMVVGPGLGPTVLPIADDLRRHGLTTVYAPDLVPMGAARSDGSRPYLLLFRRIEPGDEPAAAWRRFAARLAAAEGAARTASAAPSAR